MSHPVSALNYRVGKTLPWFHAPLQYKESNLASVVGQLLLSKNCYAVKTNTYQKNGWTNIDLLYYPMFSKKLTNQFSYIVLRGSRVNSKFAHRADTHSLWNSLNSITKSRFPSARNKALIKQQLQQQLTARFSSLAKKQISSALSRRLGIKVKVRLTNVLKHVLAKRLVDQKQLVAQHFNPAYQNNTKAYKYYYNLINSLLITAIVPKSESLVLFLVQQSLQKMHAYKVKPKKFFYFLDKVLKNIDALQKQFKAYHVTITGKLRGGTARTAAFSSGFGPLSRQTLSVDHSMTFGQVRSIYGSFGIKVLTSSNL